MILKREEISDKLAAAGYIADRDIATALGYKNIKTNTFSARLSAARQFGLVALRDEGYSLTPLARSILHPVDPAEVPRLYRQALLEPSLYADLAGQFAEKKLPDLNAHDIDQAAKIIEGTARSMGVEVKT